MPSLKDIITLGWFWHRRTTTMGLLATALVLFSACAALRSLVFNAIPAWLSLAVSFAAVPIWLWWRSLPFLPDAKRARVFLAPCYEDECVELVAGLRRQLTTEVRKRRLAGAVSVWRVPPNHAVHNEDEARKLLDRLGGGVVVYGEYARGRRKGEVRTGFRSIGFTLHTRAILKIGMGTETPRALFEGRDFNYEDSNSFDRANMVAEHVAEISLFLLGIGMLTTGSFDQALPLFRELEVSAGKSRRKFRDMLNSSAVVTLQMAARQIYTEGLEGRVTDPQSNSAAQTCLQLLDECARRTNGDHPASLPLRALIHVHFGQVDEALTIWERLARSKSDLASCLSLGFLLLWKGDENAALEEYCQVEDVPVEPEVVRHVLAFLSGVARANPQRVELKWALAFVNDHLFDGDMAVKDYEEFLGVAGERFRCLREYAEQRLRMIAGDGDGQAASGHDRLRELAEAQTRTSRRKPRSGGSRRKRRKKRNRR